MKEVSFVLIGFLLLLIAEGCSGKEDSVSSATWESTAETATVVEAVTVNSGKLYGTVSTSGRIRGIYEALIVSEASGIVQSFDVVPGQRVEKGDRIAGLDETISLLNAEQAKSAWENTRLDLDVVSSLQEKGNASRTELLRARTAESGARAAWEQAVKNLRDRTITSPLDGIVAWTDPDSSVGNYLTPGTAVARVVDTSAFFIYADLGERQTSLVGPGAVVQIYPGNLPGEGIPGRVSAVASGIRNSTGGYQAVITFNVPDGLSLKSGMAVRVDIEANLEEIQLLIPASAVMQSSSEAYVYVAENGRAVRRKVTPGEALGDFIAISGGLKIGDEVIISGIRRIADGSPVQVTTVNLASRASFGG